jgi:alkanesulfonate monooxygenase SsuD/methylene tetrahydromethanopterin reductase-like flavin-dependent oxidoreductase (luciferase family)
MSSEVISRLRHRLERPHVARAEAQNFGYQEHLDREERHERTEEYLELAYKLSANWTTTRSC